MALKVGNGTVNSVLKLEKKNGFIVFYFKKYIFKYMKIDWILSIKKQ
jgi:hypothetical protein